MPRGLHLLRVGMQWGFLEKQDGAGSCAQTPSRLACAHTAREASPGTQACELLWVCVR